MMGDKIITEIATIIDIVFEFPALSQTCLKIESPVIFQKFKSLVTVAILRSTAILKRFVRDFKNVMRSWQRITSLLNYLFNKLVKKLLWIIRCLLNCVFVKKKFLSFQIHLHFRGQKAMGNFQGMITQRQISQESNPENLVLDCIIFLLLSIIILFRKEILCTQKGSNTQMSYLERFCLLVPLLASDHGTLTGYHTGMSSLLYRNWFIFSRGDEPSRITVLHHARGAGVQVMSNVAKGFLQVSQRPSPLLISLWALEISSSFYVVYKSQQNKRSHIFP